MANYPTIEINELRVTTRKPAIKSDFSGGYQQQRPKHTRSYKNFNLGYTNLTSTQATEIDDFFIANQGTIFTFTHPTTSVVYNVMFDQDEVDFKYIIGGLYQQTTVKLREV